ncbi:MAG: SDR family oxidoreductase [Anaerolineales bacterium]|nr:SDR family oxidoreductase [Anaerolineales bacterium]
MSTGWTAADIPDLSGRVAVVTGANSGLGFETARALARRGAHVVLACRSAARGETAVAAIRRETPTADLALQPLDLADLASVRAFAAEFRARHARLDLLINNAGVMAIPRRETADGFEMQLGVNHLGHFALTGLLIEAVLAAPAARVVTVSSNAHGFGRMRFDDLQGRRSYNKWQAYSQSKLANLLFAYDLQRRLAAAGAGALSVAAHPGYAATNLQYGLLMWVLNRTLAQSAEMGALPILYAATAPAVRGGDYIGPDGWGGVRGYPRQASSSAASREAETAVRLWRVSQELTGVAFGLGDRN